MRQNLIELNKQTLRDYIFDQLDDIRYKFLMEINKAKTVEEVDAVREKFVRYTSNRVD